MRRAVVVLALAAGFAALAATMSSSYRAEVSVVPKRPVVVGISPGSGLFGLTDETLAADLDRVVDLGATWIRIDIDWSFIENQPGALDWGATDRVVDAALERDLEILGLLVYTPPWARPEGTGNKHPPTDLDAFARFAAGAVERYGPLGVGAWEIWNEPNSGLFWEPGPDPARYADLVERTAGTIRSIDPEATIVTGGLAPAADDLPDGLSPERFLREMYEELDPGTVDAVAVHPYSFPANPSDRSKDWNLFARLPEIRNLVDQAEGRPLTLWLTEFGAPFDDDDPDRQAEIVVEGIVCASRLPWVGPVFVYNLRDNAEPSDEPRFGLIFDDGRPRPVWHDLRAFLRVPIDDPIESACPPSEADQSTS